MYRQPRGSCAMTAGTYAEEPVEIVLNVLTRHVYVHAP